MTDTRIDTPNTPELALVGSDGNAFAILGRAQKVARNAGWSKETIQAVMDEATSGDYNVLLATMMKYFETN